jgi:hypothetical protein
MLTELNVVFVILYRITLPQRDPTMLNKTSLNCRGLLTAIITCDIQTLNDYYFWEV